MKKIILLILTLSMALSLAACGSSDTARNQTVNQTQTVNDVLSTAGEGSAAAAEEETKRAEALAKVLPGDYDVDLTQMNSTMVYSEVLQMMQEPDNFIGQTVKMTGAMAVYEGESRNYYACLIADATACCAQGIEFVWKGDHAYPDDYPELGAEIVVTGTFDTYTENGTLYAQLVDAELAF